MLSNKLCLVLILVLISPCFDHANAGARYRRAHWKGLDCPNRYTEDQKSAAAHLDRVCQDCYNLFRDPWIHVRCREDCFQNEIFEGCAQALQKNEEEMKQYENDLRMIISSSGF